jgi:hypothetical protein
MEEKETLGQILETVSFLKETVVFIKDNAVTKEEFAVLKTDVAQMKEEAVTSKMEILGHIDSFVGLHQKVDLEVTALRAKCERLEHQLHFVLTHFNLKMPEA